MKRSPLRRKPRKDPVTPEVREEVLARDGGCVAALLQPSLSGPCWGPLTLDHVKDGPMMGKRAPSDARHLVTLCAGHHVETPWATSNRPLLRWYLRSFYYHVDNGAVG